MIFGLHLYFNDVQTEAFSPEGAFVGAILSKISKDKEGIKLSDLYDEPDKALDLEFVKQLLLNARAFTDAEHTRETPVVRYVNLNGDWLNIGYHASVVREKGARLYTLLSDDDYSVEL